MIFRGTSGIPPPWGPLIPPSRENIDSRQDPVADGMVRLYLDHGKNALGEYHGLPVLDATPRRYIEIPMDALPSRAELERNSVAMHPALLPFRFPQETLNATSVMSYPSRISQQTLPSAPSNHAAPSYYPVTHSREGTYSLSWQSQMMGRSSGPPSIPGTGVFPARTPLVTLPSGSNPGMQPPARQLYSSSGARHTVIPYQGSLHPEVGSTESANRIVQQQILGARPPSVGSRSLSHVSSMRSARQHHTAGSVSLNAYSSAVAADYLPGTWHSTLGTLADEMNPIPIWRIIDVPDRRVWAIITPQAGDGTWFEIITGKSCEEDRAIWTVQLPSTCTYRRDVSSWLPPSDREEFWPKSHFGNSVSGQTTMRGKLVSMIDALRQKLGLIPLRRG